MRPSVFNIREKAFQFSIDHVFFSNTHFSYKLQKIEMLFFLDMDSIPTNSTTRITTYKPTTSNKTTCPTAPTTVPPAAFPVSSRSRLRRSRCRSRLSAIKAARLTSPVLSVATSARYQHGYVSVMLSAGPLMPRRWRLVSS